MTDADGIAGFMRTLCRTRNADAREARAIAAITRRGIDLQGSVSSLGKYLNDATQRVSSVKRALWPENDFNMIYQRHWDIAPYGTAKTRRFATNTVN